MKTQLLIKNKQELTVGDYDFLNKWRLSLEDFYKKNYKGLSISKVYRIVNEINRLRNHLSMSKFK